MLHNFNYEKKFRRHPMSFLSGQFHLYTHFFLSALDPSFCIQNISSALDGTFHLLRLIQTLYDKYLHALERTGKKLQVSSEYSKNTSTFT